VTALLTTAIGLPAAYVFARRKGIITRLGLGWILISQMFPLILIIIPLFLLLRDLKLTNSHIGLVRRLHGLGAAVRPLDALQLRRGIPPDLEEAATVDGATRIQILTGIIAPLLLPGIVVTTMFAFITAWNEFFLALVILESPDLTTLPLGWRSTSGSKASSGSALWPRRRCSRPFPASSSSCSSSAGSRAASSRGGQGLAMATHTNPGVGTASRPQKGGSE
jgi:ABC-type glycerol-3-phosphate transport system permease component